MSRWLTQKLRIHPYKFFFACLLMRFTYAGYAELPRCVHHLNDSEWETALTNSSCVRQQCTDSEAIVDIPVNMLSGYKGYSYIVLVTEDGCTVAEEKGNYGTPRNIRLVIPFNSCKSEVEKVGHLLRYHNRPYISYVGEKWELYFVNTSCSTKPKLPVIDVDWDAVPKIEEKCGSSGTNFDIPKIANLSIVVNFIQQKSTKVGAKFVIYDPGDGHSYPIEGQRVRLKPGLPYRAEEYQIGKVFRGRASSVLIPLFPLSAVAVAVDRNRRASFSLLPTCARGHEHVVASYPSRESYVIIVALSWWRLSIYQRPITKVKIFDPEENLVSNITLRGIESTFIPNATTGYRITSDRPIAVFTVMLDAMVPINTTSSDLTVDHMIEQLLPVTLWGSKYVVHPTASTEERRAGFLLLLVAYKRTVRLEYFGVNATSLPLSVGPFSHKIIDFKGESLPFVVKSEDGTNFMAVLIGKSGNASKTGPKAYPYMVVLQPTRSFMRVGNLGPVCDAEQQIISLVTDVDAKSEIRFNNESTKIPKIFWSSISCSDGDDSSCSDSNFTYFQYELLSTGNSSVFFSETEAFGTTIFTKSSNGFKGNMAHSGPAKFDHQQLQDDRCEIGWTYYEATDECIGISRDLVKWKDAREACENVTGRKQSLVTWKDVAKEEFIANMAAQLRIKFLFVGFHMVAGKLTWLDGGDVIFNGTLVEAYGKTPHSNCGFIRVYYHEDAYLIYYVKPTYCWPKLPYACQKDASEVQSTTAAIVETTAEYKSTAVPTTAATPVTTSSPPTPCETNPCLNNGTCVISGNRGRCECSKIYTGPYCGEFLLPDTGIYEVTAKSGIMIGAIVDHQRQKRGNGNSHYKSSVPKLLFEVTVFGGMHGFRLLSGCPYQSTCYGSLAWDEYGQVVLKLFNDGVHLLQMTPDSGGYLFSFDLGEQFISHMNGYFYLSPKGNDNVIFQLNKLEEIGEAFAFLPYRITMIRYEVRSLAYHEVESLVSIPLTRVSCEPLTEVTVCVWFRAFRGLNSSNIIPLSLYGASKSDFEKSMNGTYPRKSLESYKTYDVQPTSISDDTMRIRVLKSDGGIVAVTAEFKTPAISYRHHFCVQNDKITLDGMPFPLNFSPSGGRKITILGQNASSYLSTGRFPGQIDGLDVWCGKASSEFLFRESAMFPECGGKRGDLASMQAGDVLFSRSVKKTIILTLESACQFCPPDWVLNHGRCYHIVGNPKSAPSGKNFFNPGGGICPTAGSLGQPSWPAMVQSTGAHCMLSKYVDASVGDENGAVWFGMHKDLTRRWKWSTDDSNVLMTYWGKGEPVAQGYHKVCGAYKASPGGRQWVPMPATTDVSLGSSSFHNYQWAAMKCYEKLPYLCQQRSTSLDPNRRTLLRIFLLGGSYVAHTSKHRGMVAMRRTLATVIETIAATASGPVTYEFLRIKTSPTPYDKTDKLVDAKKRLFGWRPFPGEPDIGKVVQYINVNSNNEQFRYINIITSAYPQWVGPIKSNSRSTTFALGIMWRRIRPIHILENHLSTLTSYPTCFDMAQNSVQHQIRVARKVVSCVRGLYVANEAPYVKLTGRSIFSGLVHSNGGGHQAVASVGTTKAAVTVTPTSQIIETTALVTGAGTTSSSIEYVPTTGQSTQADKTTVKSTFAVNPTTTSTGNDTAMSTKRVLTTIPSFTTAISTTQTSYPLINSSKHCPSGYEGHGCSERAPPRPGVFEASFGAGDISGLFPPSSHRQRRSAPTKSFLFQIIEVSGHYAIRSLHGCPKGLFCLWWLNIQDNVKAIFMSPEKGYALWDITPLPEKDSYLISSAMNGYYLQKVGNEFRLSKNRTDAVTLKFKTSQEKASNFVQGEMEKSSMAEFSNPNVSSAAVISVSLPKGFCSDWTACFEFRALQSSPVGFPSVTLLWENTEWLLNTTAMEILPKQQWHRICFLISRKSELKWTSHIRQDPSTTYSGTYPTSNASSPCPEVLRIESSANKTFLGYVEKINVWSRELSLSEVQHVFTSTCKTHKGDIFSSDVPINGTGFVTTMQETPKSVCRYCQFQWSLAGDSCFAISNAPSSMLSLIDQCRAQVDPASHGAIVDADDSHHAIQALVGRKNGNAGSVWPLIPLYYRPPKAGFEWLTYGAQISPSNKTYWGEAPTLPASIKTACVIYHPFDLKQNGVVSRNFAWKQTSCLTDRPIVCQTPAGLLDPTDKTQVTIIMPRSAAISNKEEGDFLTVLVKMLDCIVTKAAKFIFVIPPAKYMVGPSPAPQQFVLASGNFKSGPIPLSETLKNMTDISGNSTTTKLYSIVTMHPKDNVTKNEIDAAFPNATIFVLGLLNTSLSKLQNLASKPDFAAVVPDDLNAEAEGKIKRVFQRYLQGLSLVESSGNTTSCQGVLCANNGTCVPTGRKDYSCVCKPGFEGKLCQFKSPSVYCNDAGVAVEVAVDIVRSLSGTPKSDIPKSVMVYFEKHKNTPSCVSSLPTNGTRNGTVYRLFAPAPFAICGLSAARLTSSRSIKVSGAVFYERITKTAIVDTSVLLSNFTCFYTTKYGIGLRPDEVLSAEFNPSPNKLFSNRVQQNGNFLILLQFYLDGMHKTPIPANPKIKVGSFLYASLYSKSPLPATMSLNVDACYLAPNPDPRVRIAILGIVKNNCPVLNDLPKNVTSVEKDKISFTFQVFQWKNTGKAMYLHCSTSICDATMSSCATNCSSTSTRRKRQVSRGDGGDTQPKIVHSAPFYPTESEKEQRESQPEQDGPKVGRKFLITDVRLYRYLLAGLILFTFLFFSFTLVIILYCFRAPHPQKYILHTRCSYRSGRRLSDSPPRTWTVVRAPSSSQTNTDANRSRGARSFKVVRGHSRVDEVFSPESSSGRRFSTFLGEPNRDEQDTTQREDNTSPGNNDSQTQDATTQIASTPM